jgi:hypothetical protein
MLGDALLAEELPVEECPAAKVGDAAALPLPELAAAGDPPVTPTTGAVAAGVTTGVITGVITGATTGGVAAGGVTTGGVVTGGGVTTGGVLTGGVVTGGVVTGGVVTGGVVTGGVVVVVGGGAVKQVGGTLMWLSFRLTAAVSASSRPITLAPVSATIVVPAKIVPTMVELPPSVAWLPTCQNTQPAWAPPSSATTLLDAVTRVDDAWKMNTPFPFKVTVPVRLAVVAPPKL